MQEEGSDQKYASTGMRERKAGVRAVYIGKRLERTRGITCVKLKSCIYLEGSDGFPYPGQEGDA